MDNLTLAITTIGDLLLRRRITRGGDRKPIDGVELSIPVYQRPYKWTARNAIQLLDDVTEARNNGKEVYRVGTLILHRNENNGNTVYDIVDGQQRIITFSLLLHALYSLENAEERADIAFLRQDISANQHSRRNIPNNLNAFKRRVNSFSGDDTNGHKRDMQRLRQYIESQCELIVVITNDLSEAFQFFDSQNARGKALYPHDLLKAYHLREMADANAETTERTVRDWESIPQEKLASFFGDYLYRIREWTGGNRAYTLNEQNIHKFKGVNKTARTPYAQFYKGAYSYAEMVNASAMPFVAGTREVNAFQLNTPIIAGKPFFDYTKHYFSILEDIKDNSQYVGFYIKGDPRVRTLDEHFSKGVGNNIARLLLDTALLLYVDRFCPATFPTKTDSDLFEQFVALAFVWAYSLRAQYLHLGWPSAQNYILGTSKSYIVNSLNIYKMTVEADTPVSLLSALADTLTPLSNNDLSDAAKRDLAAIDQEENGTYKTYLHFLKQTQYLADGNDPAA